MLSTCKRGQNPEGCFKHRVLGSASRASDSVLLGWLQEPAFVTSSQVMQPLLIRDDTLRTAELGWNTEHFMHLWDTLSVYFCLVVCFYKNIVSHDCATCLFVQQTALCTFSFLYVCFALQLSRPRKQGRRLLTIWPLGKRSELGSEWSTLYGKTTSWRPWRSWSCIVTCCWPGVAWSRPQSETYWTCIVLQAQRGDGTSLPLVRERVGSRLSGLCPSILCLLERSMSVQRTIFKNQTDGFFHAVDKLENTKYFVSAWGNMAVQKTISVKTK